MAEFEITNRPARATHRKPSKAVAAILETVDTKTAVTFPSRLAAVRAWKSAYNTMRNRGLHRTNCVRINDLSVWMEPRKEARS